MSATSELLQAYMEDDPNLITQSMATENRADSLPREDAQPDQNNTQDPVGQGNATPESTNTVAEDMEVTNLQGQRGEPATEVGTIFKGFIPTSWFSPRLDSETRKRKHRSPSLVAAADGGGQDAAGAPKKCRVTADTADAPAQEVENGVVDGQDSTTRPSGSGSEAPEHGLDMQSMPGALSFTGGGAHLTENEASAAATPPLTTNGLSIVGAAGLTPVVANGTSVPDPSHASPTSGLTGSSGGHGGAATTTPPGSPTRASNDAGSFLAKDKTPSRDTPPPIERLLEKMPAAVKPTPPVAPVAPSNPSSASSSTPSNKPDPWVILAQQFDGVRTEIQSMGTHMRTMNNNIGRLDNAMGIMTEQHTELMSVLRMGLQQSSNPFVAAGQPPVTPQTPSGSAGQALAPRQPPGATASQPSVAPRQRPGATAGQALAPRQPPGATAGQPSAVGAPPAAGTHPPGVHPVMPGARPSPASIPSRTTASHTPRRQIQTTTSPSSSSRPRPSRVTRVSSDDDMEVDEVDEGDVADTEGEIPEPLPVVVKASKLKLKGMPKARDPARKALLDDIALMARKYMGRDPDPDDDEDCDVFFDETKLPSREEVDTFNGRSGQCCTISDFRPDLIGTPRSTWNQSVAQVFAKEYVKSTTAKSKNVDEVQRAFGVHMKTLINSFKAFQASRTVNKANRRTRRRYMRKSYTHQRRMLTVAMHDGLKHHLWIIQALGVQGMSSDESEHEGTRVRYRRTTLAWRNPALETFFRVIDVFHDASRFTDGVDKSSKSGSHVHLRLPAKKISERPAVPGLPLAAYDSAWLKGLPEFFRNRLNISNVQYHFEHSPDVMKEMMQMLRTSSSEQTQQTIPALH